MYFYIFAFVFFSMCVSFKYLRASFNYFRVCYCYYVRVFLLSIFVRLTYFHFFVFVFIVVGCKYFRLFLCWFLFYFDDVRAVLNISVCF